MTFPGICCFKRSKIDHIKRLNIYNDLEYEVKEKKKLDIQNISRMPTPNLREKKKDKKKEAKQKGN